MIACIFLRFFSRIVFSYWIRHEYLAEPDPAKRDVLKESAMGGDVGVKWASDYVATPIDFSVKIGALNFAEACPLLPEMDKLLAGAEAPVTVVQLGASSGREVAWLAERHPRHAFIGTDIYEDIVKFAAAQYSLPNLSFETASAEGIADLLARFKDKRKIVISSGTLQYVQPENLDSVFEAGFKSKPCEIMLMEPGDDAAGNPAELKESVWRGGFSFTHNYKLASGRSGLREIQTRIIHPYVPPEDHPAFHRHTVVYFHHAAA